MPTQGPRGRWRPPHSQDPWANTAHWFFPPGLQELSRPEPPQGRAAQARICLADSHLLSRAPLPQWQQTSSRGTPLPSPQGAARGASGNLEPRVSNMRPVWAEMIPECVCVGVKGKLQNTLNFKAVFQSGSSTIFKAPQFQAQVLSGALMETQTLLLQGGLQKGGHRETAHLKGQDPAVVSPYIPGLLPLGHHSHRLPTTSPRSKPAASPLLGSPVMLTLIGNL